jgi:transposase
LGVILTPGQAHEAPRMAPLLDSVRVRAGRSGLRRRRPRRVAGDKGYSTPNCRRWLKRHKIGAVIPRKKDELQRGEGKGERFNRRTYRRRSSIEQLIGWLKEFRRIATRYEKLARNFLAMVKLGFILRCFRRLGFSDRA